MKKILVVDDDEDILMLVEMILLRNDYAVEAISRWEVIRESIASFEPDLILLDISLTGADGREICRELKQDRETQHIPIILFSANPDKGNNYFDCQAQAFIAKPFNMNHLLETIKFHLN
jgi:DNA-binding response OmpR family regulator